MAQHREFDELVETIAQLRAPGGCPWDRKQTHKSITKNMIEEAYEAVDAIQADDSAHIAEELGDVLLQVVLHSQIAAEAGQFSIDDVCRGINEKMIRRHPHVFGDKNAESAEAVGDIWAEVKRGEARAQAEDTCAKASSLSNIPEGMPALMEAAKISKKAVEAGFEWEDTQSVWDKVYEEIGEYKAEVQGSPQASLEFGDILFALINVARREGIDAEEALHATNKKFRTRWSYMERKAWESGRELDDLSINEQEKLWQSAKTKE